MTKDITIKWQQLAGFKRDGTKESRPVLGVLLPKSRKRARIAEPARQAEKAHVSDLANQGFEATKSNQEDIEPAVLGNDEEQVGDEREPLNQAPRPRDASIIGAKQPTAEPTRTRSGRIS